MAKKKGEDLMFPLLIAGGLAVTVWVVIGMPTSIQGVNEKLQEVVSGKEQPPVPPNESYYTNGVYY